jgi:hypothetical protein
MIPKPPLPFAPRLLPAPVSYDLEFFMPGALGNLDQVHVPALRLRARMSGKGLRGATAWMAIGAAPARVRGAEGVEEVTIRQRPDGIHVRP